MPVQTGRGSIVRCNYFGIGASPDIQSKIFPIRSHLRKFCIMILYVPGISTRYGGILRSSSFQVQKEQEEGKKAEAPFLVFEIPVNA